MDRFAFPDDETDFQQLIKDHENGALSTQMLLGTISVIDRISASNIGTENVVTYSPPINREAASTTATHYQTARLGV